MILPDTPDYNKPTIYLASVFYLHFWAWQALVVYDVDGGLDSMLTVTLGCNEGEFILGDASGLEFISYNDADLVVINATFAQGPPVPSGALRFNGTASKINLAMRNLRYRGLPGRTGQDVIRITVTDHPDPCPGDFNVSESGFNSTATSVNEMEVKTASPCAFGGSQTTEGEIQVFLSALNHPPSLNVPLTGVNTRTAVDATQAANIGAGGGLSVEDPDVRETVYYSAGGLKIEGPVSVAVVAGSGRLSLKTRGGLSFSEGQGVSDPILRFSGGIDDANRALETLSYRCSSADGCKAGTHTVTAFVDDNGFTGRGGVLSANATFSVQVSVGEE